MSYMNDSEKAKYAAEFRTAAKTENKNGQNVVSHTSIVEHGRNAKAIRDMADMYERMQGDCSCSDKE